MEIYHVIFVIFIILTKFIELFSKYAVFIIIFNEETSHSFYTLIILIVLLFILENYVNQDMLNKSFLVFPLNPLFLVMILRVFICQDKIF